MLSERKEGNVEGDLQVDGLLLGLAPIGEMLEGDQRLLKISYGLAVRRARCGSGPSLLAVEEGFVPDLTTHGVVGQTVHLLGEAVWGECCEGLDQPRVQPPPPLLEHTAVGDLVRERVFESIGAFWKEAHFIEKLGRLETRQAVVQPLLGDVSNGLQQR